MQRLTPCPTHLEDLSGGKKNTVVTNKQDLPDCCIAMLFNAHLCSEVWRQQGTQHSFLSSAKVTIAFIF